VRQRRVALATLTHLVGMTGNVVKPYSQYPDLLNKLLTMLKDSSDAQTPWALRREVLHPLAPSPSLSLSLPLSPSLSHSLPLSPLCGARCCRRLLARCLTDAH
jgi:hypothetical protein